MGQGFFELPVDAESLQRRIQGEIRSWASLAPRGRFISSIGQSDCGSVGRGERALSPFLVAASSGLFEESLADESSQAGASDVDRGLVGGQAEVFVQIADAEHLPGVVQQPQEFVDVHVASSMSSRQVGTGVVRRRSMPAVGAQ